MEFYVIPFPVTPTFPPEPCTTPRSLATVPGPFLYDRQDHLLPPTPNWLLVKPLLVPQHSPRGYTRLPDGGYPVTIVVPPPVPLISAGLLSPQLLSLPAILRTPLGFQPNYLVSITIPNLASARPPLDYNRPPNCLVLLVSTPSATSPFRIFCLQPAPPRSFLLRQCLNIVVGTALFPHLPCLLGQDYQIPVVQLTSQRSFSRCNFSRIRLSISLYVRPVRHLKFSGRQTSTVFIACSAGYTSSSECPDRSSFRLVLT